MRLLPCHCRKDAVAAGRTGGLLDALAHGQESTVEQVKCLDRHDRYVNRSGRKGARRASTDPCTSRPASSARIGASVTPLWVTMTYRPSTVGTHPTTETPSTGSGRMPTVADSTRGCCM